MSNDWHIVGVVVACAAYAAMLAAESRWGGLTLGLVVLGAAATTVAGLSGPPHFTGDLWSYAMYGRIVAAHHANPYTHVPADFPHDAFFHHVGRRWRHTQSVYGPAFTGASAIVAAIVGAATTTTRVTYQLIAAGAVATGAWLVWCRTRSPGAVAFLALHPVVAMYIINGGRNDILVGVAALGAVLLVDRGRPETGGVVAGLGALVKITGIVGLVALWFTMLVRRQRVSATRIATAGIVTIGLGYAVAGPAAILTPFNTAGVMFSQVSAWELFPELDVTRPDSHVALAVLAILVVVVIVRHARGKTADAVAGSLTMLSLGAAYTLPGYAAWSLPAAALDHRSPVARVSAASGIVLVIAYEIARHPFSGTQAFIDAAALVGPLAMLVLIVALLRTSAPQPAAPLSSAPTIRAAPSVFD